MDWIAVASAVAAWAAAFEAYRSRRISRKAHRLVVQQEDRLRPSLKLYLTEGGVHRLGEAAPRLYVFQVVVSNLSDGSNSIREVRLIIEYGRGHGCLLSNLSTHHKPELAERLTGVSGVPLRLPCEVPPRTSLGGLVLFEVPSELLHEARVEAYTLQIEDTYGHKTSIEAIFLQERAP